jgi:glycosyltransferase involved in cell wall biosynthesis
VHFFLPEPYILGAPIALLQRVPIRIMSRRSLSLYQNLWPGVRWIEQSLHPQMTALLGNSKRVVDELLEEGCDPARVGLIYNGVELDRFSGQHDQPKVRAALGVAPDAFVMAMVANLVPRKRHSDVLEAVSQVAACLPGPWTLLCVGRDDGCLTELKAQAGKLGIADNVRFLGERDDVPDILQASDMGLLASIEEGFSNAVLEFMAVGLPVVVTDVGGNAEAVVHGRTGLVVPPRMPRALADAIIQIASNRGWAAELGAAGRRRAERHFPVHRCVDQYEQLYEGLLAGRGVGPVSVALVEEAPD